MTNQTESSVIDDVAKYATLSPCGKYRYRLQRQWRAGDHTVLWIMLNPSTADSTNDDPTIRRCIAFSKAWGYEGMAVGNLFAWRATDPAELLTDDVRPGEAENILHLREMAAWSDLIVAAWGSHKAATPRLTEALWKTLGKNLWSLGRTKTGAPRHPLYAPSATRLEEWMP